MNINTLKPKLFKKSDIEWKNHLENNNFAFFVNISLIIIITILLTIYLIFDFRKIRK